MQKINFNYILSLVKKLIYISIKVAGVLALIAITLSLTDIPYNAYHKLAMTDRMKSDSIDHIVIMGGDGMPSPSGLVRTYFGSIAAANNPLSKITIALPYNEFDSLRQLDLMANELIIKGINKSRIYYEPIGFNTYSQATNISLRISDKSANILIVTAPEHMYRSVKCFEKLGFNHISTLPTFEIPSDEEYLKDKKNPKEPKVRNLTLRYNIWSYMIYEIKVLREYIAIAYYQMKGWI